jgi:RNA polymerase sigma-70 factor (ECF subfamily)
MDDHPGTIPPELIAAVRSGDAEACRDLVGRLHPWVTLRVRSQIRRLADIEDVVQEVFMRVFVKLDQFRGEQPFHHWLGRLTVNACYDWLRRQKARPAITASDLSDKERDLLESAHTGTDVSHSDEVRADLLNGLLDRLVAALKPREQIVIRLLDLEQRPVAEVADLTGWSSSKVKVTAFRARKKLAETLRRLESR